MKLLPPREGTCPVCATEHPDGEAHNAQSLYYQMRFHALRGRWPTWADAIAHCAPERRELWRRALEDAGHWTEPPAGEGPIADPPSESLRQVVGEDDVMVFNRAPQGPEDEG